MTTPEAAPTHTQETVAETGETETAFNHKVREMSRAVEDSHILLAQGARELASRQSDGTKDGVDTDDVCYSPPDAARDVEQ